MPLRERTVRRLEAALSRVPVFADAHLLRTWLNSRFSDRADEVGRLAFGGSPIQNAREVIVHGQHIGCGENNVLRRVLIAVSEELISDADLDVVQDARREFEGSASDVASLDRSTLSVSESNTSSNLGRRFDWWVQVGRFVVGLFLIVVLFLLSEWGRIEPVLPGMTRIPADTVTLGSKELTSAYNSCVEQIGHENCNKKMFDRETLRIGRLETFDLDVTEVTTGRYLHWLNQQIQKGLVSIRTGEVVWSNGSRVLRTQHEVNSSFVVTNERITTNRPLHPMTSVTWLGAKRYCESQGKRLPTEDEWEYAARGPDSQPWVWGVSDTAPPCPSVSYAQNEGLRCHGPKLGTSPVGTHLGDISWSGIRDLAGNVSEWTGDVFATKHKDADLRIVKGGSFRDPWVFTSPARRYQRNELDDASNIGFRCARTPEVDFAK